MFWVLAAGVVVVLSVVAWWTSGRAGPLGRDQFSPGSQVGGQHGKAGSELRSGYNGGPTVGGGGGTSG
jgi:hypothetical protein